MKECIHNYEQPEIEIIEIVVEKGYASTVGGGGSTEGAEGSDDFEDLLL